MKNLIQRLSVSFSRLVFRNSRNKYEKLVLYSGKKHDSEFILGLVIMFGLILLFSAVVIAFKYPFEQQYLSIDDEMKLNSDFDMVFDSQTIDGILYGTTPTGMTPFIFKTICILAGFALLFVPFFLSYIFYFFLLEKRTKFVERILPDALSLISSNMISGLTAYHAVKSAIREDFGPLAVAFEIATNKSISKKSFKESLLEVPEDIKSESLERSMKLFATAMESGSNIAYLLKNLSQDISERQALKNELITSTMTNSMFIMFMVVVGSPLLMAVSIFFVEIVSGIMDNAGSNSGSDAAGLGMGGAMVITPDFLVIYAYVFFLITGLLVSSFTGTMIEGNSKSGLKKAPIIILLSYLIFIIARFLIQNLLGGMF